MKITVIGSPAPQGSKRHVGNGIMIESSKHLRPWRMAVVYAAREALINQRRITGAVTAEMTFTMPKPKSAPKNRQTWPDKKPDGSKLVRAVEDSLTDAGVIEDDARIVECVFRKVFPGEHPDALDVPGAVIRIKSVCKEFDGAVARRDDEDRPAPAKDRGGPKRRKEISA